MPDILLRIDASDNSAVAVQRVTESLSKFDQQLQRISTAATTTQMGMDKILAALRQMETLGTGAASGIEKIATALAGLKSEASGAASAMDMFAASLSGVQRTMGMLADSTSTAVSTQQRAVGSINDLNQMYRTLAGEQRTVAENQSRINAELRSMPSGGTATMGGSGGGGRGGMLGGMATGLTFMAGYALYSQLQQSLTRGVDTQRTLAMTGATTGITPQTQAALGQYVNQLAAGGKQPFTSDVLATGLYAIPSAGVSNLAAIKAINQQGTQFSAISGTNDTVTANNALIQTMSAYGVRQQDMAKQARKYQDVITSMVNLGIVQPADVPSAVTTFGSTAAQWSVPFSKAGGAMAALTYTTRSAQQSAFDVNQLIPAIANPNQQQRRAATILGVQDLFGTKGIESFRSDPMQYLQQLNQATRLNQGFDLSKLFSGQKDALAAAMGLIGPGGQNLARTGGVLAATSQSGTTQQAFDRYEKSPAAQFDNSVAAFKTAEQQFSMAAAPLATAMLKFGTDTANWLQKMGDDIDKMSAALNLPKDIKNASSVGGGSGLRVALVSPGATSATGFGIPDFGAMGSAIGDVMHGVGGAVHQTINRIGGNPTGLASPQDIADRITAAAAGGAPVLPSMVVSGDARTMALGRYGVRGGGGSSPAAAALREQIGQSGYDLPPGSASIPYGSRYLPNPDAAQQQRDASLRAFYSGTASGRGTTTPGMTEALARLKDAISTNMGKDAVESAFGTYRQQVNANPLLAGAVKSKDIFGAAKDVGAYERGLKAPGDQDAINAAQQNLDAARMMGQTPAQYRAIFQEYLAAERQLAKDTLRGGALQKALGSIAQQGTVEGNVEATDAVTRQLHDLQNQAQIYKNQGNTAGYNATERKILEISGANRGLLKLDASDIALMASNIATAAAAANPRVNIHPFFQENAGVGGNEAGVNSTAVRIGGGQDPQTRAIRELQKELAAANNRYFSLLESIRDNTAGNKPAANKPGAITHGQRSGYA